MNFDNNTDLNNINYKNKYLKYKTKYLTLKPNMKGGDGCTACCRKKHGELANSGCQLNYGHGGDHQHLPSYSHFPIPCDWKQPCNY